MSGAALHQVHVGFQRTLRLIQNTLSNMVLWSLRCLAFSFVQLQFRKQCSHVKALGKYAIPRECDQGIAWIFQSSHVTDGVALGNSSLSFAFDKSRVTRRTRSTVSLALHCLSVPSRAGHEFATQSFCSHCSSEGISSTCVSTLRLLRHA